MGGTKELDYEPTITFEDLPEDEVCSSWSSAWVLATTEDGATSWGTERTVNLDGSVPIRFNQTGMRFPGGDLTLTYFSKQGNGFNCHEQDIPDPENLTSYKTEAIDVDWAKPEIRDVYSVENNSGDEELHIEVDSSWHDFDAFHRQGGLAIFNITDYDGRAQVVRTGTMPCYKTDEPEREGLTCKFQGSMPEAGNAIGVASIPDNVDLETVVNWPPIESIDYAGYVSSEQAPADPKMSQAGPPDSANCNRVCTGDPIDTYTGNFYESLTDLEIPGPIGLSIERQYAVGLLGTTGSFGNGWALNYDMRVELGANSNKTTVIEPSGNESSFVLSNGRYLPAAANLRADLERTDGGWQFSRWDEDLTYVFDDAGLLTSIRDENGNTVAVAHDAHGHVASVSEGNHSITFTWSDDLLTTATDHTGRTVTYSYTDGSLSSVTNPMGKTSTYVYDSEGRVSRMTNAAGEETTNTYDADGRIATQQLPSGQLIELEYTSVGQDQITTETSGDVVNEYTYDKHGRIIQFTDSSDATAKFTRTYDSASNVLSETLIDESPRV